MEAVIVSIILFVAVLLILVILAQNSKGGGLSSQFGGSGASNMIGVKKTTDLLEKLTWGLAIAMLVLTLGLNVIDNPETSDEFGDRFEEEPPALNIDPALIPEESGDPSSEGDLLQGLEGAGDSLN